MNQRELIALVEELGTNNATLSRLRRVASAYRPSAELDALIKLRDSNPTTFEKLMNPTRRISLGYYETARRAHDILDEIDRKGST